jgi:type IV pilus assembly protein PilM
MDSNAVVKTIINLANNLKIKKKRVSTSISGHSVIVKKVTLPMMDEKTIESTIHLEATQHIPYDISDVNLDFQILGQNQDNPDNMDVVLVAVKKDTINDYLALVNESGFTPVVVDVDTFALENAYEHNYEDNEKKIVALVDIGANLTCMNIIDNGITCFSRNLTSGSRLVTEQLQKQFSLDYENAELLKLGCPKNSRINATMALSAIKDKTFSLINEIIKLYNAAEKLYLLGNFHTDKPDIEIDDPYGMPIFYYQKILDLICQCSDRLIDKLNSIC